MSRYGKRSYELTIDGETVRAIVEVYGRWYAATLETPAEPPDASIVKAWRFVTNEETGEAPEIEISPATLTGPEMDRIFALALERDEHRDCEEA